jgi:hypothetical protein
MIKKLIYMISFLLVAGSALATNVVYRISSNEVVSIDITNERVYGYHKHRSVKEGVTLVDGDQCRDANEDLRILGTAKILDGNNVRNATQVEIDTFLPFEQDDFYIDEAANALRYLRNDPDFRRIMIALLDVLATRFNVVHQWDMDLKAAVAASTSLADFQSRVAALSNLPTDIDLSDVKTAIENRINKDD